MKYSVEVLPRAIKELEKIPDTTYRRIVKRIERLESMPRPLDTLKLKGHERRWRIRVGDYRVLYEIHDANRVVVIFRVVHRKEAYR
jgi:mRNA interferase RelE/StbE